MARNFPSMKSLSSIVILLFLLGCSKTDSMHEYTPLEWSNRDGIVDAPSLLTTEHLNNVEHVLKYYKVKYKRASSNKLLIHSKVDKDTQWNYTMKANNKDWLDKHPVINKNE